MAKVANLTEAGTGGSSTGLPSLLDIKLILVRRVEASAQRVKRHQLTPGGKKIDVLLGNTTYTLLKY